MFTPNQNKSNNKGKILVAFYSQTGQTKKYAQIIAQKLGADIYEIIPVRKYNDDMWAAAAEADKEIKENRYPALKGSLPDISSYNTILIGSGVWTYTLANPVVSFVRAINFNGKKVSGFWTFYDHDEKMNIDLKNYCKGAHYINGLPLPRKLTANAKNTNTAIDNWIKTL